MIDYNARLKLAQQKQSQSMMDGMKRAIVDGLSQKGGANEEILKLVFKKEENPELETQVGKIGQAIALVYKALNKPLALPKIFRVQGQVEVTRQPDVRVQNLTELKKYFDSLEKTFNNMLLAIHSMPQPQIKLPKIEIPAQVKNDNPELLKAISDLNSKIEEIGKIKIPEVSMTSTNSLLTELVNKPTYTPTPVTNVGINALEGFVVSTDNTVGTTAVTLPNYGQLFNRRSMLIFNNSANTIYIGGSGVTVATGIPVPTNSFAPSLDAGYDLRVYGIASQGGNDVRVIEISKDQTSNTQE
jgi:hypothetical protein